MHVGLISDTHGYLDEQVFRYFEGCDEVWHAGDIGTTAVTDRLAAFRPLRAVYGNIDGGALRERFPEDLRFTVADVRVWMTHIGGRPGRYATRVRRQLAADPPDVFVCGHSHALRVQHDPAYGNVLTLNPGAAGRHGFHQVRTLLRFALEGGRVARMEAIELGPRGR